MRRQILFRGTDVMLKNKDKGFCWCGEKPKKPLRAYCSQSHKRHFQNLWTTWQGLRNRFLSKHGAYCDNCGALEKDFEVDHKIAIVNLGDEFVRKNLQVLCKSCHGLKTGEDIVEKNKRVKLEKSKSIHMNLQEFGK